jgi:peptide-methionine (S)-S-oxide reductase
MKTFAVLAVAGLAAGAALLHAPARAENAHAVPAPTTDITNATGPQTIVLSGGCFWGVQGVFEHVRGVQRAVAGYAGGKADTADYETVSTGSTGHAESVQITYDPQQISYGRILQIYFSVVTDPTEVNRQGPDEGTQYRSDIFATNTDQARVARAYIAQLNAAHTFTAPIATRVDTLPGFYPAEAYHQDFLVHHPDHLYIVYNDLPKVAALKTVFPELYREQPQLSGFKS